MRGEHMKQKHYIVGLYYRKSQEDERQGESISIENQRMILRKYAEEHGFEIHDEYIDDGVSGTTFNRPEVRRRQDGHHKHNHCQRLVPFRQELYRSRAVRGLCFPCIRHSFYSYSGQHRYRKP